VAGRISSVEGTRALAATLVFLFHMGSVRALRPESGSVSEALLSLLHALGPLGTNCFLVICGCFVYRSLMHSSVSYSAFLRRRALRIYPLFLIVLSLYVAVSLYFPSASRLPHDPLRAVIYVAANAALLPGMLPIPPIITVSWTLSYIFAFYLVSPLLVRSAKLCRLPRLQRCAILAVLAAGSRYLGAVHLDGSRVPYFFVGMLAWEMTCWFKRRERKPAWLPHVMLAAAAAAAAVFCAPVLRVRLAQNLWGSAGLRILDAGPVPVICLLCFCFCAFGGHSGLSRLLASRPLRLFGGMTYSFYLTHGITLNFFDQIAGPRIAGLLAHSALAWLWYPVCFAVATVVAAAFFLLFERHFITLPALTPRRDGCILRNDGFPLRREKCGTAVYSA
jgi:exopolysaccharide production protein ExoZ